MTSDDPHLQFCAVATRTGCRGDVALRHQSTAPSGSRSGGCIHSYSRRTVNQDFFSFSRTSQRILLGQSWLGLLGIGGVRVCWVLWGGVCSLSLSSSHTADSCPVHYHARPILDSSPQLWPPNATCTPCTVECRRDGAGPQVYGGGLRLIIGVHVDTRWEVG